MPDLKRLREIESKYRVTPESEGGVSIPEVWEVLDSLADILNELERIPLLLDELDRLTKENGELRDRLKRPRTLEEALAECRKWKMTDEELAKLLQ